MDGHDESVGLVWVSALASGEVGKSIVAMLDALDAVSTRQSSVAVAAGLSRPPVVVSDDGLADAVQADFESGEAPMVVTHYSVGLVQFRSAVRRSHSDDSLHVVEATLQSHTPHQRNEFLALDSRRLVASLAPIGELIFAGRDQEGFNWQQSGLFPGERRTPWSQDRYLSYAPGYYQSMWIGDRLHAKLGPPPEGSVSGMRIADGASTPVHRYVVDWAAGNGGDTPVMLHRTRDWMLPILLGRVVADDVSHLPATRLEGPGCPASFARMLAAVSGDGFLPRWHRSPVLAELLDVADYRLFFESDPLTVDYEIVEGRVDFFVSRLERCLAAVARGVADGWLATESFEAHLQVRGSQAQLTIGVGDCDVAKDLRELLIVNSAGAQHEEVGRVVRACAVRQAD